MNSLRNVGVSLILGCCLFSNAFSMDNFCYTKEKGIYACPPVEITTDDKSFCEGRYVCQKDGVYIDAEDTPSDSDQNKACGELGGKMVQIPVGDACVAMEAITKDFFQNVSNECADGCVTEKVEILSKIPQGTCCQLKINILCKEAP